MARRLTMITMFVVLSCLVNLTCSMLKGRNAVQQHARVNWKDVPKKGILHDQIVHSRLFQKGTGNLKEKNCSCCIHELHIRKAQADPSHSGFAESQRAQQKQWLDLALPLSCCWPLWHALLDSWAMLSFQAHRQLREVRCSRLRVLW